MNDPSKRAGARLALCALLLPSLAAAAEPTRSHDAPADDRAPAHRLAYVGSGVLLAGGLGMSLLARDRALRAEEIVDARAYAQEVARARGAAASATALYATAGLTLAYALVLELLPRKSAEQAALTFHF